MYYNNQTKVFLNGNFVNALEAKTDLFTQALHYGSGVFEGIRSYDTPQEVKIFKAKEHYERLHYSASRMNLALNYSVEELTVITYKLLELNKLKDAYIRPLVFPGANMSLTSTKEVNLFIAAWEWDKYLGNKLIKLTVSSLQRNNPKSVFIDAKVSGHYVNSILATTEAKQKGFDEALLTDMNGNVAEGPGANFFFEKNNKLYTPPLGNILPGITRAMVIEIAKELGIEVIEKSFAVHDLKEADTAFLCGTAVEIIGIESIDDFIFPMSWKSSISAKIQCMYKEKITASKNQFSLTNS